MIRKLRIGIDVDLVMCASDKAWYEWLQSMCGGRLKDVSFEEFIHSTIELEDEVDYNLATYFPEPQNRAVEPFDFWRSDSTYDTVKPVKSALESVLELYNSGMYEIVFITHNKGFSSRSKYRWLKRNVPVEFSYIVTKEKYLINVDMMIDDRHNFLNGFDDGVIKYLLETPYVQSEKLKNSKKVFKGDWTEITKDILISV